ncbi:MAG TPA: glycosyltransferase family 9 protein [Gemmatimonadales bacterium]|nr:glycosyltransferase family 9 protein [Gemmatimonadales bacterium]
MPIALLKPLELRLRRLLLSGQGEFTGQLITGPAGALALGEAPRILFIRAERIGDVLVSVPVLRAVRRRYPQAGLDLLVSTGNNGIRSAVAPWVDRVWCYEKRVAPTLGLVRQLRQARYDLVVDLSHDPSVTSRLAARWSGGARILGVLHEEPAYLTHAVPALDRRRVHIVRRIAELLLAFGLDPEAEDLGLEYRLTDADRALARARLPRLTRSYLLGVNVSARGPEKQWGAGNFAAALGDILRLDPRFEAVVCGSPEDEEQVEAVAAATGATAVPPLRSFHEFAAIINACDLLLTPDTCTVHLAAAWRIPLVGLFHADPAMLPWTPYGTPHRAIVHQGPSVEVPPVRVVQAMADLIAECFP